MASAELATPLTVEEILESLDAKAKDEVHQPDFMEPLKLFMEGFNNVDRLTVRAKRMTLIRIRTQAVQRAEVKNAIVRNPDILTTPMRPVVIIGMARTGTTMLQRLLASAPEFISPMTWEVMFPCPPGRPDNWKECGKYKRANDLLESLFPGGIEDLDFQNKHEIKMEAPEECMLLLQSYFLELRSPFFPTMEKLKNYIFNPPEENLKKAYEYYKKALQCIFYKSLTDGKVPLLKAPIHTLYLDMYRQILPNAKFIFPYRNAREMVGSGCSLFRESQIMFGMDIGKDSLKKSTLEYYRLGTSRVVNTLKTLPQDSFFTVPYSELVKDPMAAMKTLYSHFGWKMSPETEDNMNLHMQENRQHKQGQHKYSLEEYGITDDEVRENLSDFLEYFGKKEKLL